MTQTDKRLDGQQGEFYFIQCVLEYSFLSEPTPFGETTYSPLRRMFPPIFYLIDKL